MNPLPMRLSINFLAALESLARPRITATPGMVQSTILIPCFRTIGSPKNPVQGFTLGSSPRRVLIVSMISAA